MDERRGIVRVSDVDDRRAQHGASLTIPRERDAAVLRRRLETIRGTTIDPVAEASALAEGLQRLAQGCTTLRERFEQRLLARALGDPTWRALLALLTDQLPRRASSAELADRVRHLVVSVAGERSAVGRVARIATRRPQAMIDALRATVRLFASRVVLPAEDPALGDAVARLARSGAIVNLNHLGEAVLGEREAEARMESYVRDAARSDVACISVKLSALAPRAEPLALDANVERALARLRPILDAARRAPFRDLDGQLREKLVYLDMEGYREVELTLATLRRVLGASELDSSAIGVALQAYLPDSHTHLETLHHAAEERVARGGAPLRLRLVKGANLAAERVESAIAGFPQPVYPTKAEVDASFKRLLDVVVRPESARSLQVGVGSHNVFDLAFALVLRAVRGVEHAVGLEMLAGMNEPLRRAVQAVAGEVLVYAPAVAADELESAIAYLIRRLDENASEENFLRHAFSITPDDPEWARQRDAFVHAYRATATVSTDPRRTQDRRRPPHPSADGPFRNEPDTDFTRPWHRDWIAHELDAVARATGVVVPVVVGGREDRSPRAGCAPGTDPSRPGVRLYDRALADEAHVDDALRCAIDAGRAWSARPVDARYRALGDAAQALREARGPLIATMVADGGKIVAEADVEVSEAIDFAELYRRSARALEEDPALRVAPRGVVVVAPPWNFPLAIPAGGVLGALAAGNAVILKPAPETAWVAYRLAEALWRSGIPRELLQFLPCEDEPTGSALVRDPRVDAVVLTGATETAQKLLRLRPDLHFLAETGGKNATIVTSAADRDLAIDCVVRSAFGHAGQKCSATSLLVLEASVHDDARFLDRLADAAATMRVGSAWDPATQVPPLIRPPEGALRRTLDSLDAGESWLLPPRIAPENPALVSPGIRVGVRRGSFAHTTELFGPVLSVMRAKDLDDAIAIQNETRYGLTAGLQSLDEREQRRWAARIEAGNLYVNRTTTGAIVHRQPFGGIKASSFGPTAKAGGEDYVVGLMRVRDADRAERTPEASARSYAEHAQRRFLAEIDPVRLLGQDNLHRFRARLRIALVVGEGSTELAVMQVELAAKAVGASLRRMTVEQTIDAIPRGEVDRVRMLGRVPDALRAAARDAAVRIDAEPPIASGRIELLAYVEAQSLTIDYHRYGNLGERAGEGRAGPS